jgi:hypothetical protein
MGFFEVEVNDVISTNPFTITFANYNGGATVLQYVSFQLDYISIVSICNTNPVGSIDIDTNYSNSTMTMAGTGNSKIATVDLTEIKDIYSYWKTNSVDQDIDPVELPAGSTAITLTLKNSLTGTPINVPQDYNRIQIRFHVIGI